MSTTKRQRGGRPRAGPAAAAAAASTSAVAVPPWPSAACATGSFHARPTRTSAAAGVLDSDDEDPITKKVMELLEEEVRGGQESDVEEAEESPEETENAIAPERPLVPVPLPLVAVTETIEILWKADIKPFKWRSDIWEVADFSLITVYEWMGGEGSHGLCCVGHHPFRDFPVQTAWRVASGRKGRPKVSTNGIMFHIWLHALFFHQI